VLAVTDQKMQKITFLVIILPNIASSECQCDAEYHFLAWRAWPSVRPLIGNRIWQIKWYHLRVSMATRNAKNHVQNLSYLFQMARICHAKLLVYYFFCGLWSVTVNVMYKLQFLPRDATLC